MKIIKNLFYLLLAAGSILFTACITDHTDDAVEKARQYVFDNLRPMTEMQRQYVMFNQPEIYENVIFPHQSVPLTTLGHIRGPKNLQYPTAPGLDLMHSCIVWSPPDLGSAKIMVIGKGERCMRFWTPIRVVIKDFNVVVPAYKAAVSSCIDYARNNMLYLTPDEQNRIRFGDPKVVYTKLNITHAKGQDKKTVLSDWEAYLNELETKQDYEQISLVWEADAADKRIVFSGWTTSKTLAGWKLQTSELMTEEKLKTNQLTQEEMDRKGLKPNEMFQQQIIYSAPQDVNRNPQIKNNDMPEGGSILWKK